MHLNHEPMSPVFDKWHLDGAPFPAVLHRFSEPDMGPPHDHPWSFRSIVLHGGYVEQVFQLDGTSELVRHEVGDSFHIPAGHIHRIVELPAGECWTLILPGQHERKSGFYDFRPDGTYHRYWDGEFEKMGK
jgi:hypothetical protein